MDLWLRTLPLFLAAAVSPTMLAVSALVLMTPKGRTNLVWLTIGWSAAVVAFIALVGFGGHATTKGPDPISAWIDIGLGVLMIVLGVLGYARRNKPKKPKDPSKGKHHAGPAVYLGGGVLGLATDFSSLVPLAAAIKEVGRAPIPSVEKLPFAIAGYLFISLPLLVPLAGSFIAPKASERLLNSLNAWLKKHGPIVVLVVFAIMGAYLIFKGGRVLHWFG